MNVHDSQNMKDDVSSLVNTATMSSIFWSLELLFFFSDAPYRTFFEKHALIYLLLLDYGFLGTFAED